MPYFTSWDANVFLCLLSVFPEEVVRMMIKNVKKVHEEYIQKETLEYHCSLARHLLYLNNMYMPSLATQQLKEFWKWRCPEERRENIVKWTEVFAWTGHTSVDASKYKGKGTSRRGYWNSVEAWWYSLNDRYIDTSEWNSSEEDEYFEMKERERRNFISKWYEGIHEGRFFLFFKENDIFSTDLYDNYRNEEKAIKSICDLGSRQQVAQDLLTIDGPGLGERAGGTIKYIDDIFV